MLLDLNMPKKNGFEVLEWLRSDAILRYLPVIILSNSARTEDVERAFDLGATSFLIKPSTVEELITMMRCLREWLHYNHFPSLKDSTRR
jgi:CheY-like chemotaxis protein